MVKRSKKAKIAMIEIDHENHLYLKKTINYFVLRLGAVLAVAFLGNASAYYLIIQANSSVLNDRISYNSNLVKEVDSDFKILIREVATISSEVKQFNNKIIQLDVVQSQVKDMGDDVNKRIDRFSDNRKVEYLLQLNEISLEDKLIAIKNLDD